MGVRYLETHKRYCNSGKENHSLYRGVFVTDGLVILSLLTVNEILVQCGNVQYQVAKEACE